MITHVSKCWIYSRNNLELIAQEEYCLIFPHWLTILKFTVYHTTSHFFLCLLLLGFFFLQRKLATLLKMVTFDKEPAFSKSPLQLSARSINLLNWHVHWISQPVHSIINGFILLSVHPTIYPLKWSRMSACTSHSLLSVSPPLPPHLCLCIIHVIGIFILAGYST